MPMDFGTTFFRVLAGGLALWAAVEIFVVGEPATKWVRAMVSLGFVVSAGFWLALAVWNPPPEQFEPFWTTWSRLPNYIIPFGIIAISRRRREINGYH